MKRGAKYIKWPLVPGFYTDPAKVVAERAGTVVQAVYAARKALNVNAPDYRGRQCRLQPRKAGRLEKTEAVGEPKRQNRAHVEFDAKQLAQLDAESEATGLSHSGIVKKALAEYFMKAWRTE